MKKLQISAIAFAVTSIAAGSAMAQSSKTNAWEGFYGQVGVGYGTITPGIQNGTAKVAGSPVTLSTNATNVNNLNTGVANIAAGYNYGINDKWIVGLGLSYDPGASSTATGTLNLSYGGTKLGSTNATYQFKNVYSVTVNPGYAIDKDKLAYMMLGYTGATVGLSSPDIPYNTVNLTGYVVGLGYKQMVTQSLYMLGEVKYASYGQKTASIAGSGVTLSNSISANGAELLVGVGYRF